MEQVSIDEAFVDISGCESIHGKPSEIGRKIKHAIKETVHLTCSVGIAPLKFLAKIASDMNKPDGLTVISRNEVGPFIQALPVDKISGVGKRTGGQLKKMGIFTLGDVKSVSRKTLVNRLGKYGDRLYELANGVATRSNNPEAEAPIKIYRSFSEMRS